VRALAKHPNVWIKLSGLPTAADMDDWTDAAIDAKDSRLWGGIHWRFDNDTGLALGNQIAAYTLSQRAFNAVPEPDTWAMLIAGFGIIGATARRRRGAGLARQ